MRSPTAMILVLAGAASACSPAGPSSAVIEIIERRLARQPCVGDVGRWHRVYAYRKGPAPLDTNDVGVWYREPDSTFPAGRFVRDSTDEWPLDDSRVNMAFARYDVGQDQLTLEYCGPNVGGANQRDRIVR
jgi:hypothetical protein